MTDQHQALHAYLERVIALRDQHARTLRHDELRSIAREVGLSDADLERAASAAADHLQRARGFMQHHLYDEAISELREAQVLVPDDVGVMEQTARAYAARWERDRSPDDLRAAMQTCREVVAIDPEHSASFELLGRLNAQAKEAAPASVPSLPVVAAALGLVVAIMVGAGVFFIIAYDDTDADASSSPSPQIVHIETPTPPPADEPPADEPRADEPPADEPPADEPNTRSETIEASGNIEMRLVLADDLPAVAFSEVHAELNTYPNSSFFKINGLFVNSSTFETQGVQARLRLLDQEGVAPGEPVPLTLHPSYMPALRPGDARAFRHQMATFAELSSVEILIDTIETQPAPSSYTESTTIEATIPPGPGGVTPNLELRQRHFEMKTNEFLNRRSMHLHLEVENTGQRSLELLRLRVDLLNASGDVVDDRLSYVVSSGYPALAPGQTRLAAVIIADLAKSVIDYRVSVVEWR